MSYAYLHKGSFESMSLIGGYHTSRVVYHVCGAPFQIAGNISDIQDLFKHLGLAFLRNFLTGHYHQLLANESQLLKLTIINVHIETF